ncbi:trypsin-1 [Cephus cinctus]|uniref:trypsin n=1 Tax=Cephus cinctus TaxID=211228 RepID=A0AAJ7CEF1_CEPCN|nr:trypsin-1 [Cephus cinctus]
MLPRQVFLVSLLLAASNSFVPENKLTPTVYESINRGVSGRLIGSDETTIANYPYVVSLQYNSTFFGYEVAHFCTGTIVNQNWVVTAAECALLLEPENLIVRAGSSYYNESGIVYTVENVTTHEDFDAVDLNYDIGLIKIRGSFQFSDVIQPVKLPTYNLTIENGTMLDIASWGVTEFLDANLSPVIRKISVPTITIEECSRVYEQVGKTQIDVFCAHAANIGPCVGDAGAGAVRDGVLLGLVAWSYGCGGTTYPTVYSNVPRLLPWIIEVAGITSEAPEESGASEASGAFCSLLLIFLSLAISMR